MSNLSIGRLYPRRNPWYSFLEAESTAGHMVLSVAAERILSDITGNRSRDRLRDLVNPVIDFAFHKVWGCFLTSEVIPGFSKLSIIQGC